MISLSQYMSIKAESRSSSIVLLNLFLTILNFEKLRSFVAEVNAIVAATTNAMKKFGYTRQHTVVQIPYYFDITSNYHRLRVRGARSGKRVLRALRPRKRKKFRSLRSRKGQFRPWDLTLAKPLPIGTLFLIIIARTTRQEMNESQAHPVEIQSPPCRRHAKR